MEKKLNLDANVIILNDTYCDCERGNIWLVSEDSGNQAAYFLLKNLPDEEKMLLLEVGIAPSNYPGFNIGVVTISPEALALHLKDKCGGWLVRKLNLVPEGSVETDSDGYIVGEEI